MPSRFCCLCRAECEVGRCAFVPKHPKRRLEWKNRNPTWPSKIFFKRQRGKEYCVCSKHFTADCFDEQTGNLKRKQIPEFLYTPPSVPEKRVILDSAMASASSKAEAAVHGLFVSINSSPNPFSRKALPLRGLQKIRPKRAGSPSKDRDDTAKPLSCDAPGSPQMGFTAADIYRIKEEPS